MRHGNMTAVCGLTIVALMVPAATVRAAEDPGANAQRPATTIRSSVQRAAATLADQSPASSDIRLGASASATNAVPLSLPKSSRVHKSTGMLIVTAVSLVASVAGTMYALKMMKDAQDKQPTGQ